MNPISMKEKYIATLVGCAIGDMLGMPVEGWKKEQIKAHTGGITRPINPVVVFGNNKIQIADAYGKLKYFTRDLKKGEYTDDTILTLALAESIAEKGGISIDDIARKQMDAYLNMLQPNGRAKGGFGGTTVKALKRLQEGYSAYNSGVVGGPGNGPAMKMAPLGIYIDATGKYKEGLAAAEAVGKITHLDPRSIASGVVQAHATYALLHGISRSEFVDSLVDVCAEFEKPATDKFSLPEKGSLWSRLDWVRRERDASSESAYARLGNSALAFESYPFALFMFQKYWQEPQKGLLETVNYGGDCDTTGAIFGALSGAKDGMWFPKDWLNAAIGLERLITAAEKLYTLSEHQNNGSGNNE